MKIYLNDPFKKEKQEHASRRRPESLTEREKWDSLSGPRRAQYIWDYYKLPILIACIILYIAGYGIYRHVTHKDVVLYAGLVNVSPGETLEEQLSDGFLREQEISSSENMLQLYSGWYLTDDPASEYHEYTYATRLKVLSSIDSQQLDVVFMNREAFDSFAQNGYLYNIEDLLCETDPSLYERLRSCLVTNTEILEDNAKDILFDSTLDYVSETTEYPMAIDLSDAPMIKQAGFGDTVYFGIVGNSPRTGTAIQYLNYLFPQGHAEAASG